MGFVWLVFWIIFYEVLSKQKRLSAAEYAYIKAGQEIETDRDTKNSIRWYKFFKLPQTWALIAGKGLIDLIYCFFILASFLFFLYF